MVVWYQTAALVLLNLDLPDLPKLGAMLILTCLMFLESCSKLGAAAHVLTAGVVTLITLAVAARR